MKNWSEQQLIAPKHVMFRELAGEAVLLNLQNEMYYGLDEVGTRMWKLLTTCESIQAAVNIMLEEFEVAPDILEQDVARMIREMQEQGLLETVNK